MCDCIYKLCVVCMMWFWGVGSAIALCVERGVGSANGLSMGREAFAVDLEVWGVVEFAYEI